MILDKEVIIFDDEILEIGKAVFTLTRLIEFCFLFTRERSRRNLIKSQGFRSL